MIDDRDPPADRRAQQELGDAFRELARERTTAMKKVRRDRRQHVLVRAALTALSAILLGGGLAVAIGELTADDNDSVGGDPRAPDSPQPTGRVLARSTAADPLGGPRCGLSTYTSKKDEQCVIAARVVNGQMGVISNGRFTPLRRTAIGFCDKLSRSHLIFTVGTYSAANGGRTVLYGQADREVQRLVLQRSQRLQDIRLFSDGTFLVVVAGVNALRGSRFTATVGGKRRTYQLG